MLDFIFATATCFLFLGLLFSPVAPEITVFFIKDKAYHNRYFAVLLYFMGLVVITLLNVIVSWFIL